MSGTKTGIPLESGDRLSREEFHRRYCERHDIKKAELVQGVVYVASPVRYVSHGRPQRFIMHWLSTYALRHPGVECGGDTTVLLDDEDEVQPDAFLFVESPSAGGVHIRDDEYIEGAPQLVVEVAASSASYDLHDKLRSYERAGVNEYIVWRTRDGALDWFRLRDGIYERVAPNERGIIESIAFPGLRLHVAKLLAGDLLGLLAELETPPGA